MRSSVARPGIQKPAQVRRRLRAAGRVVPAEIATGAESEDEMGAFHGLYSHRVIEQLKLPTR